MRNKDFYIEACWDDEAKVYYSKSNINGLQIETETLAEFHELAKHFAPELIRENHINQGEKSILDYSLRELIEDEFIITSSQKPEQASI